MNTSTKILRNFNGDNLAADVFTKKYAVIDADTGEILETSISDMRDRIAKAITIAEEPEKREYWEEEFRNALDYFMPGGRILYALGNPNDETATLKNCYVIKIEDDSISGIFETARKQAVLFSKGGGVGFDLSPLRPAGAPVNNSAKTTTGSVSFMDLYSMVTGIIGQYGRRGALMLTMDCSHPDVIEFIKIKGGADKNKVQFANISIRISDAFMNAVKNNEDWVMSYKLKDGTMFNKIEKANIIWDLFVESNWRGAEPGIMFWDNIIKDEPAGVFDETRAISTNPCFTGDTLIATNKGDIKLADIISNGIGGYKILTYNIEENIYEWEDIIWGDKTKDNATVMTLKIEENNKLYELCCTPEHKIYTTNRGYVEAKELTQDDDIKIF